jgi:hypothetical protein
MAVIVLLSFGHSVLLGMGLMQFLESFMGVFFVVFSVFKLRQLNEFAHGFRRYDLIAAKSLAYSYFYPFIQLTFGLLYLLSLATLAVDIAVLIVSLVSGAGVAKALLGKKKVHCLCLGSVIKLPLSTISFVEDFGMALMAFVMILLRI